MNKSIKKNIFLPLFFLLLLIGVFEVYVNLLRAPQEINLDQNAFTKIEFNYFDKQLQKTIFWQIEDKTVVDSLVLFLNESSSFHNVGRYNGIKFSLTLISNNKEINYNLIADKLSQNIYIEEKRTGIYRYVPNYYVSNNTAFNFFLFSHFLSIKNIRFEEF
jgi:hypothetical protein